MTLDHVINIISLIMNQVKGRDDFLMDTKSTFQDHEKSAPASEWAMVSVIVYLIELVSIN